MSGPAEPCTALLPRAWRRGLVTVAAAVLAPATLLLPASPAFAGGGSYVVRSGDSLWLIAREHGSTPERLARLNRLSLASPLPVGLRLRLVPAAPPTRYVVRAGDTLGAIAERFGTTVPALARTNRLDVDAPLLVGTRLQVPRPAAQPSASYVVQAGDTLTAIAARLSTTAPALARMNHLAADATLPIGLRLLVPSRGPGAAPAGGAPTAAAPAGPLAAALGHVVDAAAQPGVLTAALVIDITSGQIVYERNADATLAPASLEKLPLALAAFASLGASFRIETDVLAAGPRRNGLLAGDLVLKGGGDPTLDSAGLALLAAQVRAAGITEVQGRVVGDASLFDSRRDVDGWKPDFVGVESPPLSALVVDRAVLDGRIAADPAAAAAELFRRALIAAGVRVDGVAASGTAPAGAVAIAHVLSPELSALGDEMLKTSDNFVAEMLLKQLGARRLGLGTSRAGAQVVQSVLAQDGLPPLGVVDGSGLSRLDTVSARSLGALLLRLRQTPALVQALPVAGVDGTLARRLAGTSLAGRVHAKSGTTDGSSGLAGFLDDRYAFVLVSNGAYVPQASAHALQDTFLLTLGAHA